MKCPFCRCDETRVTQIIHKVSENKRYRRCLICSATFVTVERLMNPRIEKEYENDISAENGII